MPSAASPADLPRDIRLQIVASCPGPPDGDGWLHEIKHDGHRLAAIIAGGGELKLVSRNGYDRTELFREPFQGRAGCRPAYSMARSRSDERGVTHIDLLTEALRPALDRAASLFRLRSSPPRRPRSATVHDRGQESAAV